MEQWIECLVFRHLWWWNEKGDWIPDLVEQIPSVENGGVSKDGKTIRFRIRPGAAWHDGAPLTSDDVKFTLETLRDSAPGNPFHTQLEPIGEVWTPDARTVELHLLRPWLPLFSNFPAIAPAHLMRSVTNWASDPFARKPLGSGPYEFVEWVSGSHILLKCHGPVSSGPERIVLKFVPDENNRLVQLRTHEVDLARLDAPEHIEALSGISGYNRVRHDPQKLIYVSLNNDREPLTDRRVRWALHYATNKTAIITEVYAGHGAPAEGSTPPLLSSFHHVAIPPYDPPRAKAMLEEAGWKTGPNGIRQKDGKPLRFEMLVMTEDKTLGRLATVLQQEYRDVGVEVSIAALPAAKLYALGTQGGIFLSGQYDIAASAQYYSGSPDFPEQLWERSEIGTNNFSRYRNPRVDQLLEQAGATMDRKAANAIYAQVQEVLASDSPIIPILWQYAEWAVTPALKNFRPGPISDAFWNAADWSF